MIQVSILLFLRHLEWMNGLFFFFFKFFCCTIFSFKFAKSKMFSRTKIIIIYIRVDSFATYAYSCRICPLGFFQTIPFNQNQKSITSIIVNKNQLQSID